MVRTARWAGVVPHSTTATGVSARPAAGIRRPAMLARVAMPMRMTSVPPARASDSQSTPPGAVSSPTWPVTTVTELDSPRWVTGTPGGRRARRTPRSRPGRPPTATPAALQRLGLLAAAAEEERVAALQADDRPAGPPVLDQQRVDVALARRPPPTPGRRRRSPAGRLPTSISAAPGRRQASSGGSTSRS